MRRRNQRMRVSGVRMPSARAGHRGRHPPAGGTPDGGTPVPVSTGSRELGHRSTAMVEMVYSDLGTMPHRSEVVEYRVEQHAATLGDRLTASAGEKL